MTVTVAGEAIPLPEVLAALTLEQDFLVLPSGLYVTTDRPEFDRLREVVAAAAELRDREGDRIGVGRHDLGLWAQLAEAAHFDAVFLADNVGLPNAPPEVLSRNAPPHLFDPLLVQAALASATERIGLVATVTVRLVTPAGTVTSPLVATVKVWVSPLPST